jgi:hypothetical protein
LSTRVTEDDLEKFFSKEGKVWSQLFSSCSYWDSHFIWIGTSVHLVITILVYR